MDEVFVYNCPSCGGKVEYINNKWHCTYCNNTYDALFAEENNNLPDLKIQKYTMYHYKCSKCNNTFVSLDEKNAKCNFCNEVVEATGTRFIASNIIDTDVSFDMAKEKYIEDIQKYSRKLSKNYFLVNLKGKYLYCDLYNGCIKFKYKNVIEKYIFANLLIPNIKNEDYKFMYELGNIGISHSSEISKFKSVTDEIINNGNYIFDIENINYEEDIVNECLEVFSKKHKISDVQNIKMEKNLEINEGTFVPVYVNQVIDDNKEYNQYIIGNSSISKVSKTFFLKRTKRDNVILEFKEEKNALSKYKKYKIISSVLEKIAYFLIPVTIFATYFYMGFKDRNMTLDNNNVSNYVKYIFFSILILFIITTVISFYLKKKKEYYYNSIKLTKKEYLNQIINNSNYVKVLKVKK